MVSRDESGKGYYIRETGDGVRFYLLFKTDPFAGQLREADVLSTIWAWDRDESPDTIIEKQEEDILLDSGERVLVFKLPSRAYSLNAGLLAELTVREKEKLFRDAERAVRFLHENTPPLYHRDITPEAFMVCRTRGGYKLFLSSFDCTKVENARFTVNEKVFKNRENVRKQAFISEEIMGLSASPEDMEVWRRADLYALGKLGVYLFTGGTDPEKLKNVEGITTGVLERIEELCGME